MDDVSTVGIIVGVLGFAGGVWGFLSARAQNRHEKELAAEQAKREAEQARRADAMQLVDQLQEELGRRDRQHEQLMERIDRMWADKAASRNYVGALRDHIWARNDPPPPEPPENYIP